MRAVCAVVALIVITSATAAGGQQQEQQQPAPPKRPATLAVDTPVQTLALERCVALRPTKLFAWIWSRLACQPPRILGAFSERIYDKSHTSPLERVSVRVDALTKAGSGFDPNRNLAFTFDKTPVDLFSDADAASRRVNADGQANIGATLTGLDAGEYSVTLRFVAANSIEDDASKMTAAISVKDEPWVPLIVVTLGVLVSFVTKKIFVVTRDRIALKARIAKQNSTWLRNEPPSSAVVWAQANLRLARTLARNARVALPDLVGERLTEVEALLPTLRAIRDVRKLLEANIRNPLVLTRAKDRLARLTGRCSDPPLSAATAQQIAADLASIEAWTKSEQLAAAFWADRLPAIKLILATVRASAIVDAAAKRLVDDIVNELTAAVGAAAPPQNVFNLYERYAALEILWDQRNDAAALAAVVEASQEGQPVAELFRRIDGAAWDAVKDAVANNRAKVVVPAVRPQTFEPFTVRVTTGNADLDDAFLFKFKLRFAWRIELTAKRWWKPWGGETTFTELTPESVEPAVQQYAPRRGSAIASVTIWNGTESVRVAKPESFRIEKSDMLPLAGAMERIEFYPLVAAAVIAILTGMSTQYVGNAIFGSTKDYLTLFLWGAAVDLVKNVVQPTAPATPSAPAAAAAAPAGK